MSEDIGSVDPFATRPAFGPPLVDVVPSPPTQRRWPWLLGAFVLIAAAVTTGVVLAGRSSTTYSLNAATANAVKAHAVGYEMTISAGPVSSTMTGRQDLDHQLAALQMDIAGKSMSMILDIGGKVLYVDASAFGGPGVTSKWVSMDMSKVPAMQAQLNTASATSNPLDMTKAFAKAKKVEKLEQLQFRGETVQHYRLTVDIKVAIESNPTLKSELDKSGVTMPDDLVYDAYVTKASQMRRVMFSMPLTGQTFTADMVFTSLDTIVPIEIPPKDQVTDITKLLSTGAGG